MYDDPADTGILRRMQVLNWIAANRTIFANDTFPLIFDFSFD